MKKKNVYVLCLAVILMVAFPITAYAYKSVEIVENTIKGLVQLVIAGGLFRLTYKVIRMMLDGEAPQEVLKKSKHYIIFMILAITLMELMKVVVQYF